MFDYWHSGWHMWWMGTSWIVGLVMIALFIWALIQGTAFQTPGPQEGPEAILKRRYAQGELTTEDYNQRLIELRK
jgi:putative membrane protein